MYKIINVHYYFPVRMIYDSPNHHCLTPATWRQWVRINDLHCPRSFVKSISLLNVSPTDSMSSFILSIHRSLGLPLFLFFRILHVVHCVEFSQLSFSLHVQTIRVFAGR